MVSRRSVRWSVSLAAALLVAGCGGGGGSNAPAGSTSCDLASQQDWLRGYMQDWYFWSGSSPNPAPAGYATLADYFEALKYANYPGRGIEPWSNYQDSVSYNRFFAEGRTLGYGLFVNGNERQLPLRVRMVEPLSPAGIAGLQRGDTILAIDGVASDVLITGDFAVLNPAQAGAQISVDIERAGVPQRVVLSAAEFALTPVPVSQVLTLPGGGKAGYVMLKDFITQAETPLVNALAAMRSAGATELIVDLRYNGGGRISTANQFASQIVGAAHAGGTFATLNYNAARQSSNTSFVLATGPGAAFSRVVVLTGPRTCSASELLANGLAPFAQVVTIGGTSCGKPYGFNPVASCSNTFSVVNFRALNARGEADYDSGLAPTCPVSEDFSGALGDPAEKLTAAALSYLQTGNCPAAAAASERAAPLGLRPRRDFVEPGERRGMTAD